MAGMALSPDGQKVVALPNADEPQEIREFVEKPNDAALVLATATGKRLGELLIPRMSASMFMIGPDNNTLFAGGSKAARTGIGRWNLTTGMYHGLRDSPWPHPNIMPMAISPTGKTLLCYLRLDASPN